MQGQGLPLPQEVWPYQCLFYEPLIGGDQKASLASLSPQLHLFRHLEGSLCLESFSVVQCLRHIEGPPLSGVLFCWYIPDVSMEGDVLHIHLLLHYLVLIQAHIFAGFC